MSGFLTYQDIRARWDELLPEAEDGEKVPVVPPDEANPASVDLRLGSEHDITSLEAPGRLSDDSPYLIIPPGAFALLKTWEVISVPLDMIALITMRFTYKGLGLINISGFHIDPGWRGPIIYSVYNAGPSDVPLKWKEAVFTIFFATLVQPAHKEYAGDHKGQTTDLPMQLVQLMRRPTVNPVKLDERLKGLEGRVNTLQTIAVLLIGAIVSVGLTIALTVALTD